MVRLLRQVFRDLIEGIEDARRATLEEAEAERRTAAPRPLGADAPLPELVTRSIEPLAVRAPAAEPSADGRAARLRERLRDPASVREALILKEILDRPLAHRRGQAPLSR